MTGQPTVRLPRPAEASHLLSDLLAHPLDPGYVEAARRRAEAGPRTGWRLLGARASTMAALVLVGFLFSVAYQRMVVDQPQAAKARADLIADVRDRRAETEAMQRDAEALRQDVAQLSDTVGAGEQDIATLHARAAAAGLAQVSGRGAVVTLTDAAEQIDPVTGQAADDNPGLVLDRDLQEVVNTLWQVGAEAIAINGQRLTSVSTIRAAGGVVLVDFKPITSPYRVSAIGSSDLASAFEGSRTATRFRSYRQTYRMGFSVRSNSRLTLPAASEPQLRYAHPPSSPPSNPPSTQPASPAPASLSPSGPPAPSGSG